MDNVPRALEVLDAIEHRDLEQLLRLTDPEVEWRSAFAVGAEGGVYRGHDGMRCYVKDMNDAWGVVRFVPEDQLVIGDLVVLVGRINYRGKESGVAGERAAGYVIKFRDGRATLFRPFHEPERALEAVGLAE